MAKEKRKSTVTKKAIFFGRVQGVGFRYMCREEARGFEVRMSVQNLRDGTVELLAAGEEEEVDAYLEHIKTESSLAHHIKSVSITVLGDGDFIDIVK